MEDHRRITHGVQPHEEEAPQEAPGAAPTHSTPLPTSRTLDELMAALRDA